MCITTYLSLFLHCIHIFYIITLARQQIAGVLAIYRYFFLYLGTLTKGIYKKNIYIFFK